MAGKIVTLLTDFGTEDGYVGAMKGVLLSGDATLQVVDISHQIRPFDVRQAAFALYNYYRFFPKGTVHIVVVDPGVGTERTGLVVRTADYYFVGPDNGVFSFIYEYEVFKGFRIEEKKINPDASATFHGRDIFVPVALKLLAGEDLATFTTPYARFESFYEKYRQTGAKELRLKVIHIDHFGNLVLNFTRQDWEQLGKPEGVKIRLKRGFLYGIQRTFGEARKGQILALWDSSGFLQISQNQGNAARMLEMNIGDELVMEI